jgi:hypothetical protein
MVTAATEFPRLAIFGDSHYASVRQAHNLGLVDVSGAEIEYWGHVGRRFNFLALQDGAIVPTDDYTAQRFAKFNEKGRRFLPAADFDMMLFVGTRTHLGPTFLSLLHTSRHGPFITAGLRRRILQDALRRQFGYRLAMGLAGTDTARIVLAPVSFPTEGFPPLQSLATPDVCAATSDDRGELWQIVIDLAAEDHITLLPQPEGTVIDGAFTMAAFAVDDHIAKQDYAHRNAAYGALVLAQAMQVLRDKEVARR